MKYIIRWNAGFGDSHEIVEAESHAEAMDRAYSQWKEEADTNADYDAEEYSDELAEELCLIDEDCDS